MLSRAAAVRHLQTMFMRLALCKVKMVLSDISIGRHFDLNAPRQMLDVLSVHLYLNFPTKLTMLAQQHPKIAGRGDERVSLNLTSGGIAFTILRQQDNACGNANL